MWILDRLGLGRWRRALVTSGQVLEVGCGTGRNLPLYPLGTDPVGVDPDLDLLRKAQLRAPGARLVQARVEALPFRDASFETVVSSLVFCSVQDPAKGLDEIRRILPPGGQLRMLEHVRPERRFLLRLAQWIGPTWTRFTGGCHLDRDTVRLVGEAGFEIDVNALQQQGVLRRFEARRPILKSKDEPVPDPRPGHPSPSFVPARGRTVALVLGLSMMALGGCDLLSPDPVMCTTEFRMLTLRVQDAQGNPLPEARVDVRRPGEAEPWPGTGLREDLDPGRFVIVHDGHAGRIGLGAQATLNIDAQSGTLQGSATWIVGSDICHIYKVVGTDTLILR